MKFYSEPKCHRCGVFFKPYEQYAAVLTPANKRGNAERHDYHPKCLPPNLFHQMKWEQTSAGVALRGRVATD